MLAPSGRRSSAMTDSCLDPAIVLRDGFLADFGVGAFFATPTLVRPRTFIAGLDFAARAVFPTDRSFSAGFAFRPLRVPRQRCCQHSPFVRKALRRDHRIEISPVVLVTGYWKTSWAPPGLRRCLHRHDPGPAKAQSAGGAKIRDCRFGPRAPLRMRLIRLSAHMRAVPPKSSAKRAMMLLFSGDPDHFWSLASFFRIAAELTGIARQIAMNSTTSNQLSAVIQNGLFCDWDTRPWSGEIAPKVTVNRVD